MPPLSSPVDLSIVIVSYNVRDLLENCLHSLEAATSGLSCEVFVVDNNSDDGSAEMVRQRFPQVRLVANSDNRGFAAANNQALCDARGQILCLLNPDTFVQEDTFHSLLAFFRDTPEAGMAGCRIIRPDGTLEPGCRRSFPSPWVSFTKLSGLSTMFADSPIFARYNMTYKSEHETYEVDAISGSFMMLRREVYEQIGGLDETYFMYGEDLDWCYRTQKAGWKLFYVHSTNIIHYGGESTKRSSIDAMAEFYRAMHVFARKNLGLSPLSLWIISAGIRTQLWLARSRHVFSRMAPVLTDASLAVAAVAVGELLRFGRLFLFPAYAYPMVYIVAVVVILLSMFAAGAYTQRNYGIARAGLGVLLSFLVLSTLPYFFREYAFSRGVVLISTAMNLLLLPGWRIAYALVAPQRRTNPLTGKRTLLVGATAQTAEILSMLRRYEERTYNIIGVIDVTRMRVGELHGGVEILGTLENMGKIIRERDVTDVIFGPDVLPYADILSIISTARGERVQYRMVPKSMEFIVGKASYDQLSSVPLLDFEYNLARRGNRTLKRVFDIIVSVTGIVVLYFFARIGTRGNSRPTVAQRFVLGLPSVFSGRRSLVGYDEGHVQAPENIYLGKPGLTGLAQLRNVETQSPDEMLSSAMQYARNYSVFLDIEILLRTFMSFRNN